jgi:hypothetical protein
MKKLFNLLAFLNLTTAASAQCISGDCNNGIGMYKDSNFVYEGPFKNGMPHGKGRLLKANGDMYEGGFEYGMYNGTGTLYGGDSSIYTGSFHQGYKQGKGSIAYIDGKKYEGLFSNNQPSTTKMWRGVQVLNFYSGQFDVASIADIDENKQRINTEYGDFDINTGKWSPSDKATNLKLMDGYVYRYNTSNNRTIYDTKLIPKPKLEKKVKSCQPIFLSNLETDNNYIAYFILDLTGKKDREPHNEIRVYKINEATHAIEEINRFKTFNGGWGGFGDYHKSIQTKSGSTIYIPKWKTIYNNYGKNVVYLEDLKENELNFSSRLSVEGEKQWFSEKGDTLYTLDRALRLLVFDVYTGKRIRLMNYVNNHFNTTSNSSNNIEAIIAVSGKSMKCVALTDSYLSSLTRNGTSRGTSEYGYAKAVLLDLNDPDYMLPLRNPFYTYDFFTDKATNAVKDYDDFEKYLDGERQKILEKSGLGKSTPTLFSDLDEDNSPSTNTAKKKRTNLSRQDMDNIIKSNSSPTQSGESAWDKLFREREKQSNIDYKKKNDGYRGY